MPSDTLILGAGLAGLAAAERLASAGQTVTILEARNRIGGRAWSRHRAGLPCPIELGAEWIDGDGAVPGILGRDVHTLRPAAGHYYQSEAGGLRKHDRLYRGRLLKRLAKLGGADRSVEEALQDPALDGISSDDKQELRRYIQGFHAANPATLSLYWFLEVEQTQSANESQHRATGGVGDIAAALATGLADAALHLDTAVTSVRWKRGAVSVEAVSGNQMRTFAASTAVVTLPLPILKDPRTGRGSVRFEPALDARKTALDLLDMGHVYKVTLEFKREFWRDIPPLGDMLFLQRYDQLFPTWWSTNPARAPLLCGWAAGPHADRLADTSLRGLLDHAVDSLGAALGVSVEAVRAELVSGHCHDWQADPYARGSYTNVLVGGLDAWKTLAAPMEGTLFFAGEATCGHGFNATMEGAIASGRRAAEEVLGYRSVPVG